MNNDQFVDSIIEEEKLDVPNTGVEDNDENSEDVNKATEESQEDVADKGEQTEGEKTEDSESDEDSGEKSGEDAENKDSDSESAEKEDKSTDGEDEAASNLASRTVEESKTLISNLTARGLQPFDDKGNVRPFEDVVPAGAYFASQLSPVKVIDKEGKTHEFLLISDVEKAFPDGFEAKNNIEQMKFERGIKTNEDKFDAAIAQYNQSKSTYESETAQIRQQSESQENLGRQYAAMAKEGLVPEVGDKETPSAESVKELTAILTWMEAKNKDLSSKGLGEISSLYVAKQLMDKDLGVDKKTEKAKAIDKERKQVASLNRAPQSGGDKGEPKKAPVAHNMSTFAEQLIAEEGLN
jgi:hypothetical protein